MMDITDSLMYFRYYKKTAYLNYIKVTKGLDFTGRIEGTDDRLRGYEGCYPINSILRKLKITKSDSVLDIGCGKGLFLYYATQFKFRRIDGIEYSAKLTEFAEQNAAIISDERIHVYHQDARNYVGYDKYNYFFINNPFSAEIMEEVIVKLKESYLSNTRKITVIYQFPFNREVFINHGFKLVYEKFPNAILTFG